MKKNSSNISIKAISIFLLIALSLVFSACAPTPVAIEAVPEVIQEDVDVPNDSKTETVFSPVEFTDTVGQAVVIDEQPKRIVSLAPSITESLFAVGAGDLLVGRTEFCDYPGEALELPAVGGFTSSTISTEAIIALEPDLVIGGSIYQTEVIDALTAAGINAFILEPSGIAEIINSLVMLGQITGSISGADALAADMQNRISAVEEVVATIPSTDLVSVYYEVWNEPYMTASDQTFIGELIKLAGGENIFGSLEEDYPSINSEEIIDRDPLVILGPSDNSAQLTVEAIAAREGWSDLSAVTSERIYILDGNIVSRAGPRVVDALEAVARSLYPDHFGE